MPRPLLGRPDRKILLIGLASVGLLLAALIAWLAIAGPVPQAASVEVPLERAEPAVETVEAETPALLPPSAMASPVASLDGSAKLPPPPEVKDDRPKVAILITELGPSPISVDTILQRLPPEIGLAFLPFTSQAGTLAQAARHSGHEVLIDVPMEPATFPDDDPGPDALMSSASLAENARRLDWDLERLSGFVGLVNYMGSRFTTSEDQMTPVLKAAKQHKLFYIDLKTNLSSVAASVARTMDVPFLTVNVQLDSEQSHEAMEQNLARLEADAKRDGMALGVITPLPMSLERLALWIKSLPAKGLVLVPVSAIVRTAAQGIH